MHLSINLNHVDCALIDEIKPLFHNVAETFFINVPLSLNKSTIENFQNETVYTLENGLRSVSLLNLSIKMTKEKFIKLIKCFKNIYIIHIY